MSWTLLCFNLFTSAPSALFVPYFNQKHTLSSPHDYSLTPGFRLLPFPLGYLFLSSPSLLGSPASHMVASAYLERTESSDSALGLNRLQKPPLARITLVLFLLGQFFFTLAPNLPKAEFEGSVLPFPYLCGSVSPSSHRQDLGEDLRFSNSRPILPSRVATLRVVWPSLRILSTISSASSNSHKWTPLAKTNAPIHLSTGATPTSSFGQPMTWTSNSTSRSLALHLPSSRTCSPSSNLQ